MEKKYQFFYNYKLYKYINLWTYFKETNFF